MKVKLCNKLRMLKKVYKKGKRSARATALITFYCGFSQNGNSVKNGVICVGTFLVGQYKVNTKRRKHFGKLCLLKLPHNYQFLAGEHTRT